jgi:AcrR family transcriptional regulator
MSLDSDWDQPAKSKARRILEAAMAVFGRRGFSEARMDDVAVEAGVSKGGLYLHFKSKEELFDALVGFMVGVEMRKLERAMAAEGPVADRLAAFFHGYAEDMASMEKLNPIIMEIYARAMRSGPVRAMVGRYLHSSGASVSRFIASGIESGEFRPVDPDQTGLQIICLLEGLALLAAIDPEGVSLPDMADSGVRLLLDGLLMKPNEAVDAAGGEG